MKAGDLVIWDSHFGYELGIYVGDGVMYNTINVYMLTGKYGFCRGDASVTITEVLPFTLSNYKLMVEQYHNTVKFTPTLKSHIRKTQSEIILRSACEQYNL